MPNYICVTCGVQYAETTTPPEHCIICEDERQYVGWEGQKWTTLEELRANHVNRFTEIEPRFIRIGTEPLFGIGQHAYLVPSPNGNVLWDCITLLDDATIEKVRALGGISAIAISHPHYCIPLPASQMQHLVEAVEPFAFDRLYSPWLERVVIRDGKAVIRRSAERYLRAIQEQET